MFRSACVVSVFMLLPHWVVAADGNNGYEAFEAGNYADAAKLLEGAVAADPEDVGALTMLGVSYQQLGEHERAINAFRRILALDPDDEDVRLPLGISYFQAGLYNDAESQLKAAAQSEPDDGTTQLFLGLALRELGKPTEALTSLELAAELDPDLRQVAMLNIGVIQRQIGKQFASQQALRSAVNINPGSDIASSARNLLDDPADSVQARRPWEFSVRAGAEYDDNVTIAEIDVATEESDAAAVFEVSASYQPYKTGLSEIELGYDFYRSMYSSLSDFDLQLNTVYALGSRDINGVDAGATYQYTHATLGGHSFFEINKIMPSMSFSIWKKLFHSVSYTYQDKDYYKDNDRDADQHGGNIDSYFFFRDGSAFVFAGVRVEDENTEGPEFDYFGYYGNLAVSGSIDTFPAHPARVRTGYQYYHRDYEHETLSIGKKRDDKRHTFTLNIVQPISRYFSAILNYQFISADSNLPSSDFDENIVTLSLEFSP